MLLPKSSVCGNRQCLCRAFQHVRRQLRLHEELVARQRSCTGRLASMVCVSRRARQILVTTSWYASMSSCDVLLSLPARMSVNSSSRSE